MGGTWERDSRDPKSDPPAPRHSCLCPVPRIGLPMAATARWPLLARASVAAVAAAAARTVRSACEPSKEPPPPPKPDAKKELKADAKKNKDDIAKLTTSLEAANSDIIGLKKLVKDTQDNNDTNKKKKKRRTARIFFFMFGGVSS